MKKFLPLIFLLAGCMPEIDFKPAKRQTPKLSVAINTKPDHIVIVWLENKAFSQIIGSSSAPYINSLISKGTLFTNSYALFHPSYPNYIAWFCGSNYGVTNDDCINLKKFDAPNQWSSLNNAGRSFYWASEDLPEVGSQVCISGRYVEKHNPVTIFKNVPDSINVPLSYFNTTDSNTFDKLPNVLSVTPNMINDMHDGTVRQGDDWIKAHFANYITWAQRHNSIFMVYFDEDNRKTDNRIPVIAVGAHIKPGYKDSRKYTHYSFSKFVLSCNGADTTFKSSIKNAASIQGVYQ